MIVGQVTATACRNSCLQLPIVCCFVLSATCARFGLSVICDEFRSTWAML